MFRILLRLLPRDLRGRWSGEMDALLRDRLEEARSGRERLRLLVGASADLVWHALHIRLVRVRRAAWSLVQGFGADVRHGSRALLRAPGFSLAVLATLTLGVGAVAAVFSVVDGVLLRPLPYRDAGRLALVRWVPAEMVAGEGAGRPPGLSGLAGFSIDGGTAVARAGRPSRVRVMPVSGSFFDVLGVQPQVGRALARSDDRSAAAPVAVVSHGFWSREYGTVRRPAGETVALDGRTFEVVGVMPPGFTFYWYDDVDLWIPTASRPGPGPARLSALARLGPGTTPEDARRALAPLSEAVGREIRVTGLREAMVGDVREPLLLFLAAAMLVLLVAVANAGNLVLGRGLRRRDEIAVRLSLGAGRMRVLRRLLVECGLLAGTASLLALLVGTWGTRALLALAPGYVRQVHEVGLDLRVASFAIALGCLATLGAGLVPGLAVTRAGTPYSRRSTTAGRGVRVLESGLVALQIAMAVLLVSTSGVVLRTFVELRPADPGFRVADLTVVGIELPRHRVSGAEEARVLTAEIVEGLRGVPGVRAAEAVTYLPLTGVSSYRPASATAPGGGGPEAEVHHRAATPGYVALMEMTPVAGRREVRPGEVVVNERAAALFWPGREPLGRLLHIEGEESGPFAVVGVVEDARIFGGTTSSAPEAFTALSETPWPEFNVVLDAPGGVAAEDVRSAVRSVDPGVPVVRVEPFPSVIAPANRVPRFQLTLVGSLALLALGLAGLGTFAVFSCVAARRRREIGVRVAMGARRSDVVALVMRSGAGVIALGLTGGCLLAGLTGEILEQVLFRARGVELPLLAAAAAVLASTGALALLLPALRAAGVDPAAVLREE